MNKLKNLSVFKFAIILVLNIFFFNKYLILLSIIYLVIEFRFKSIIVISLFGIILISNVYKTDYIKYGYVEDVKTSHIVVDKILYKTKVYTENEYKIGDFVETGEYEKSSELSDLKYNILFISYDNPKLIHNRTIRSLIFDRFNSFDNDISIYLKNILLNNYSNESNIIFLGYGFSFYYLLLVLKRKNKLICLLTIIIYTALFKFDIKFYLIIFDVILEYLKIKGLNKLSFKIVFIILINKYLLINTSILLSFIFTYIYMNDYSDRSIIMIVQSLFFHEIQLGLSFIYKYIFKFRIVLFIFSLFVLFIPKLSNLYLVIITFYSKILSLLSFGIRGRISFIGLIIYLLIRLLFKKDKEYFNVLIIIVLLIPCINNPIRHINFIDVGQGDATLIRGYFGNYNILIDTGSTYNYSKLKKELYKEGIYSIDYLIISHSDDDHAGNVDNLKNDFKVKDLITIGKDIEGKDFKLKYLYLGDFNNENDNSLVYLLEIDNRKILFTGDVSKKVENIIISKYDIKNIDILKIGHHGSNTSSSSYFIGVLNPEYVTISTNGKYNHPHEDVINILDSYKLDYLITKNEGSIKFYLTKYIDFCITKNRFELI